MPNQPIVTAGLVLRETVTRETDKIMIKFFWVNRKLNVKQT